MYMYLYHTVHVYYVSVQCLWIQYKQLEKVCVIGNLTWLHVHVTYIASIDNDTLTRHLFNNKILAHIIM